MGGRLMGKVNRGKVSRGCDRGWRRGTCMSDGGTSSLLAFLEVWVIKWLLVCV